MKKRLIVPLLIAPLFLFGCGKNKNVYASSKNTIYKFELNGEDAIITGLNDKYKNQGDIIIPYSIDKHVVKKIEKRAFEGVYRLKNVDMSKSKVEEIGEYAFKNCSGLEVLNLDDAITKIDEGAFMECKTMTSFDLSAYNIEVISDYAFSKCESLTDIKLPNSCTTLGSYVFDGCTSLTDLDLSNTSIKTIEEYGLYNVANLKSVAFPTALEEIKEYALSENALIRRADLSKTSIKKIGDNAFSNCKALTNVDLASSLEEIGVKAFYRCPKLEKIDFSGTQVKTISESCFELCSSLKQIVSFGQVETISSRAFYSSDLTTINISKSVKSIADDAFVMCKSLSKITVLDGNTAYTDVDGILYTANKDTLLVFPSLLKKEVYEAPGSLVKINQYAFANAIYLKTVKLESANSNFDTIDDFTFMNCTALETFTSDDTAECGIKKIGVKAFFGCSSLTEFYSSYALEEIGESAFYDCVSLTKVDLIKSQLTKIDTEAFFNCNKLKTLTLDGALETIGRSAFVNCLSDETSITYGSNSTDLLRLLADNPNTGLDKYKDSIIFA